MSSGLEKTGNNGLFVRHETVNRLPPASLVRQLFRYEPETGKLYWRSRTEEMFRGGARSKAWRCNLWNSRYADTEAFTSINKGYKVGAIFKANANAHRVAWAVTMGEWPSGDIDHINHDRTDNRWENLRCVERVENSRNSSLHSSNKSGVCGVSWHVAANKWRAYILTNDKQKHLGLFSEFNDAVIARKDAEKRLGFHENHGMKAA